MTDENGNVHKVEDKPVMVSIKFDDVCRMMNFVNDALQPNVTYTEDIDEMREEAERISRQSIKMVRDMLAPYVSQKY